MRNSWAALISVVLVLSCACSQKPAQNPETEALDKLTGDFWTWRAKHAPFTGDDANRIERPGPARRCARYFAAGPRESVEPSRALWQARQPSRGKYAGAPAANRDHLANIDNSQRTGVKRGVRSCGRRARKRSKVASGKITVAS